MSASAFAFALLRKKGIALCAAGARPGATAVSLAAALQGNFRGVRPGEELAFRGLGGVAEIPNAGDEANDQGAAPLGLDGVLTFEAQTVTFAVNQPEHRREAIFDVFQRPISPTVGQHWKQAHSSPNGSEFFPALEDVRSELDKGFEMLWSDDFAVADHLHEVGPRVDPVVAELDTCRLRICHRGLPSAHPASFAGGHA